MVISHQSAPFWSGARMYLDTQWKSNQDTPVSSKTDVKTDQDTWIISKLDYHSITTMQLPSDIEVFSDKDYKP